MKMKGRALGHAIVALHWILAFVVIYPAHIQQLDCTYLFLECFGGAKLL